MISIVGFRRTSGRTKTIFLMRFIHKLFWMDEIRRAGGLTAIRSGDSRIVVVKKKNEKKTMMIIK
jgi:hypothetical protein